MAIHLTRIYTKTGDDGTTALGDLSRTRKTGARVGAYADVDEANSAIGVALALASDGLAADVVTVLRQVQNDLFDLGADLCTPITAEAAHPPLRVQPVQVSVLEEACDRYNAGLAPLRSFVLPGGTPAAALLHAARTAVRRAERSVWALREAEPETTGLEPARYLNRLSDLLFILARVANPGGDVSWVPGGSPRV